MNRVQSRGWQSGARPGLQGPRPGLFPDGDPEGLGVDPGKGSQMPEQPWLSLQGLGWLQQPPQPFISCLYPELQGEAPCGERAPGRAWLPSGRKSAVTLCFGVFASSLQPWCLTGLVGEGESQMGLRLSSRRKSASSTKRTAVGWEGPRGRFIQQMPRGRLLCPGWLLRRSPGVDSEVSELPACSETTEPQLGCFQRWEAHPLPGTAHSRVSGLAESS